MKTKTLHTSLALLLFLTSAIAQQQPIRLKNGVLGRENNITRITADSLRPVHFRKSFYVLLQFQHLPGSAELAGLRTQGIRLFNYLPGRTYLAELPDDLPPATLQQFAVTGVYNIPASIKISPRLADSPEAYTQQEGQLIAVQFFGSMTKEEVSRSLEAAGARLVSTKIKPDKVLFIRAGKTALQRIATLPYISYIGPQSLKDRTLNYNNRAAHGLDALNNDPVRNLQGNGVTVGIGDDASPYMHVDFTGRQINRFGSQLLSSHGVHTSGTAVGGGIANPLYKGMAPHATLISQYFSDILTNTDTYIGDYNMVLTNNSYTAYNSGCPWEGEYDFLSYYIDGQLNSYPNLLHVFAAGNDGVLSCTPYAHPYATIKSGYQCSKNALTVGNLDNASYTISNFSSCGPVNDGRLKPEIVAGGTNITSTAWTVNGYYTESGTSMSSPTVTGTLALLVQRYRQLHGGADPAGALLKTIACNTATDLGNPGPDFLYGFGSLNARAAVEALEANRYIAGTVNNTGNYTYTLTGIPAGLRQLKVLLYWPDVPATPNAATALVNDLDLTVTGTDAVVHQPLILNPTAGHTTDNAVEGADHLNNIEQVVIDNPPAGNFTLTVKGASVASGSQSFVLAWQPIQPSVILQYPLGFETWTPGSAETIRWNAYGGEPNPFTLEYSSDNGSSWTTISNSVPSSRRLYTWTAPATVTNQGLIRVSRNGTAYSDVSGHPFTILGQPGVGISSPCQGYVQLAWGPVASATSYDIFQLKGDSMSKVASTTSTVFLLGNLRRDSTYWFAVSAVAGGVDGRRSLAVQITPSGGTCALPALNNDITIDSLIGPLTGRQFTSSQPGSAVTISIELKNLGTIATSSPISLSYRINNGAVITESSSATIPAGGGVSNFNFTTKADLSTPGAYTIQTWVTYPGDPQSGNDTLTTVVKHLQNDPIALNPAYTEGFESAAAAQYTGPVKGFTGLDRCDFSRSNSNGRARTFINSGFARTGVRSAILDQIQYSTGTTADSLITTFNLSGYTSSDQIWLNFYYRNQGIDSVFPGNQVWIRGNDQAAWIPVSTLDASFEKIGSYQASPNIDVSGALKAASQTVSSSFQIKFGQEGHTSANSVATDGDLDDGYAFDDITLTRASNDASVLALTGPALPGICNLSNAETISIKVRNYSGAPINNIPVTYSINGVDVTEQIPSINANDSIVYSFTHKADLSSYKTYSLRAWVNAAGDTYKANDSLPAVSFHTVPQISRFPYLEGFEANDGYWYTGGSNSSWQWGTPAKTIIDKAAGGTKCWATSLTGNYNDNELSYLYSPCFDLSTLANPVLSFSHIFQTEDNCMCDFHWVEYSTDGTNWTKLGATTSGTGWYDNAPRQAWQLSDTRWHVSSYDIPVNSAGVRFRIAMNSDPATNYEGVGIDDIHIFDKTAIYSGVDTLRTQPVSGNDWVNFDLGGRRIVSLQSNGQDLGNVTVKVFINTGGVRNDGTQYYLDRNIVIQPSNAPAGNVKVRYYFLDGEVRNLLAATNCPACSTLADAYRSGIAQYSSPIAAEEDSSLTNNTTGFYHFLLPHQNVSIIPYDNGYYAEYTVSGFSEFWINAGGPGDHQPEGPVLLSFTAARSGATGLLQWNTSGETNARRFIIEKSHDGISFTPLDSVNARNGDTVNSYRYVDNGLWKGANHYRLKLLNTDGRYNYSPTRTIDMDDAGVWVHIYPNPFHTGELHITSSSGLRSVGLVDVSGRIVLQKIVSGNAHTLTPGHLSQGIYFILIDTEDGRKVEKLLVK